MEILGSIPSCNALNKVHYQIVMVAMGLSRKPMLIMSYIEHSLYKMSIATCVSSREVDKIHEILTFYNEDRQRPLLTSQEQEQPHL